MGEHKHNPRAQQVLVVGANPQAPQATSGIIITNFANAKPPFTTLKFSEGMTKDQIYETLHQALVKVDKLIMDEKGDVEKKLIEEAPANSIDQLNAAQSAKRIIQ